MEQLINAFQTLGEGERSTAGARSLADLETVTRLSRGRVDLTIGSALDIFGGTGVRYADAVAFNRQFSSAKT